MKLQRKINKNGYSLSVNIPSEIAHKTGIQFGDVVSIDYENNKIVVELPEPSKVTGEPQPTQATSEGQQ